MVSLRESFVLDLSEGDIYRTETAYTLQSLLCRSGSNRALPVGWAMRAWEVSMWLRHVMRDFGRRKSREDRRIERHDRRKVDLFGDGAESECIHQCRDPELHLVEV